MTVITVGTHPETSEVPLYGINPFLAKYHMKAQFVYQASDPASLEALAKGETDFGILGYTAAVTDASDGIGNVKVITGFGEGGQNLLLNPRVTKARTWSQLRGLTIGAPTSTAAGIYFEIGLAQHHMLGKVKIAQAGFTGTAELQALKAGTWAGLVYWSPIPDQAVLAGYGTYVPGINLSCTVLGDGNRLLGANARMLAHRQQVVDFLRAFVASMRYYQAHLDAWATAAAELTSTNLAVTRESLHHQALGYHIDIKGIQAAARYGPEFGYAKADVSAKIPGVIDPSFLASATGQPVAAVTSPQAMPPGSGGCAP